MKKLVIIIIAIAAVVVVIKTSQFYEPSSAISETPLQAKPSSIASYACDAGKVINVAFYEGTTTASTSVMLSDGRALALAQTVSADGARYADANEAFVFWSKGNGALVLENNKQKSYIGCILVKPQPSGTNLSQVYANSAAGFSLRLPSIVASSSVGYPDSYKVDETNLYQALGPNKTIHGIKFVIPASMAQGTNLSDDSYLSVEQIPRIKTCSAGLFLSPGSKSFSVNADGMDYSIATSTGAAAGNRYEETVYAIPGTNPCVALRYFVHYGVFENYPAGTISQFDRQAVLSQFDQIRRTLTLNQ